MSSRASQATRRVVLFDLDNTLIDRQAAFRAWASGFLLEHGLREFELAWLETIDEDGFKPRELFFAEVKRRFRLPDDVEVLVQAYRPALSASIPPLPRETVSALVELRERGWAIGIVTNGSAAQETNLLAAGLAGLVDGWAVSAIEGIRKPEPRLFAIAARACGASLVGGWMVGDRPDADIAGAIAAGLRSVWIARGRTWLEDGYEPDATTETIAQAVQAIVSLDG
jgi:FMN phosphatase YigB (HAD superfamily)